MNEITANLHIHSKFSDGQKSHRGIAEDAIKACLDVIFITDHNIYPDNHDGYFSMGGKKVLVIVGEEIHDVNRVPQKNHLLALGIAKSYNKYAASPQNLINAVNQAGGLTFIAHAYDPEMPAFNEHDLSWVDWTVDGFTGMELWNNLSELKVRARNSAQAVFYALFPAWLAKEPPRQIRDRWDALHKEGRKVVAIGGSDAHMLKYRFGPLKLSVFPYSYHFRTINTHILLENPLNNNTGIAREQVLKALKIGNAFIANDSIISSWGFRFSVSSNNKLYPMGSELKFKEGMTIKIKLPFKSQLHLIKDGQTILRSHENVNISYAIKSSGVYRVECYRKHLFLNRAWIVSNPIYIR